jgi:DNA polymerase-4
MTRGVVPRLDRQFSRRGVNTALQSLCRDCLSTGVSSPDPGARCGACGSRRRVSHERLFSLPIAHVDCDAFYAAIEKRDDPALRDRPVIVGGGVRGVVTTCCYIARASGVRSAMPMFKALALCRDAVVRKPDMARYAHEGRRVRALMQALTPLVEAVSIDEAYLDLSGTERLHGAPPAVSLARLQSRIEAEVGITVSVGLSANKFLAKTASDLDKPRGFAVLAPEDVARVLWPRPVGFLHGIGPAQARILERDGFSRIADLAAADPRALAAKHGEMGARLHAMAHGRDDRPVRPDGDRKSISAETTFNADLSDRSALEGELARLAARVGERARASGLSGRVVTLKLKTPGFRTFTRRLTLPEPTATGRIVLDAARPLLAAEIAKGPFRLIGVGLSDLRPGEEADKGDLLDARTPKRAALERALDTVAARYGRGAIKQGKP